MKNSDNIQKRRSNGSGSVTFRRDGRWEARWYEETIDGRKRRAVYAQTPEAAEQKMRLARGEPLISDVSDDKGDTVYFIQSASGGPIKIGVSGDVQKRLAALQMCCPVPLRVLHVIPNGGRDLESKLHKRFAAHRLHGEWFENTAELLRLIHDFKTTLAAERI